METKNMIGGIVSLAVVVICVAAIMVPILNETVDANVTTYTNATEDYRYKIDGNDDYEFITSASYTGYTINGEAYNMTSYGGGAVITTDKCRVETSGHLIALMDETGTRIAFLNNTSNRVECTYDASEKLFTFTTYTDTTGTTVYEDYTVSYTVENIVYLLPDGDYCRITTEGDEDAPADYYVNDLSQVIAGGAYTSGELDTSYFAEGTTVYVGNESYTGSATATTTDVIKGVIQGSTYTITITDGETSESFTPYTIFVPVEVSGETTQQVAENSLYSAIPVIVIAAIVIASISMVAVRRD